MPKIPSAIIGLLSSLFPEYYTHAEIDSLFQYAGAPEDPPDGSKPAKVQAWLRRTNKETDDPLKVLGEILDDFMEKSAPSSYHYTGHINDWMEKFEANKLGVERTLQKDGWTYRKGGIITKSASSSTQSLEERVASQGLSSVNIEIERAMAQIENDPNAAAHYAGNVLEASLKAYLASRSVDFQSKDGLAELWKKAAADIGLRPAELGDKDLKKIASGMNSVVDGIAFLRNRKSGAHGKSEIESKSYSLKPRHARLAVHAAHTVSAYVLELIE